MQVEEKIQYFWTVHSSGHYKMLITTFILIKVLAKLILFSSQSED